MSDAFSSCSSSFIEYDEQKTIKLYRSIVKMLQEVQELVNEVNSNYKALEGNMNHAAQLITAIQINEKSEEADVTASLMTNK